MQRLTLQLVVTVIIFCSIFVIGTYPPKDPDTWWHIHSGEYTLTQGMIYNDPFSHTMYGEPWINHGWGAQLLLYWSWQLAGDVGLALYVGVLATAGMYFVYRNSRGTTYPKMFTLILGAMTAGVFWSARPQMTSFFLSALILYWLYSYKRQESDRLWLIPPLMALWGNLHAGFSIGFIFMGGFIAGEIIGNILAPQRENAVGWNRLPKLIIVAALSVPALVINPYGLEILTVPFQTVGMEVLQDYIQEWKSPDFHQMYIMPFAVMLLLLLGVLGGSKKPLDWTGVVLVTGTAFMALLAGRNIAVFAVVAVPIISEHLDSLLKERGWAVEAPANITTPKAIIHAVLIVVMIAASVVTLTRKLSPENIRKAQTQKLPVLAMEHIRETQPEGLMFNSYAWGGYLMFMFPDRPVYVDGRTDLYRDAMLTEFIRTERGQGDWAGKLDEDNVQWVVITPNSGLASVLRITPEWVLDYEDPLAVIFIRDNDQTTD